MKLKLLLLFLTLVLNLIESKKRTCKSGILRSFGYHGRITPNRGNALCPKIIFNCCTMHDQMSMHKQWNDIIGYVFSNKNRISLEAFNKINIFIAQKSQLDLFMFNSKYLKLVKIKPPKQIEKHLNDLAKIFSKYPTKYYKPIMHILQKNKIPKYFKWVKQQRAGTLCGLCNYQNNRYFDMSESKIQVSRKFCVNFARRFIDTLADKYLKIINLMIVFDEWAFMVSNRHLFSNMSQLNMLKRIVVIVKKCKKDPSIKGCANLCQEYNLNKFSYIFDGESKPILLFMRNFNEFTQALDKNPARLFNKIPINWADTTKTQAIQNNSVMTEGMGINLTKKKKKVKKFKFKMSIPKVTSFVEKIHPTNSLQIETLDDEVDSYTLYKVKEKPIDITSFEINFGLFGFNPSFETKRNNFHLRVPKILAMLHSGGNDPNKVSEILEKDVKKYLNSVTQVDMVNYFNDKRLSFKKLISPGQKAKLMEKIKAMKSKSERVLIQDRGLTTSGTKLFGTFILFLGLIL